MARRRKNFDVIVMGGGPAGSCVSTLLAKSGRSVLLLEKETFPRHHIGESFIPETYWPLKKMGMLEKLKASNFTKKFSVQFGSASGKTSKPFYFFETNHHESAVTWQVLRSEFDKLMLDHARETGVDVREATRVKDVIFDGDRAIGVEAAATSNGAEPSRYNAKVIVDATGLNAILGNKLGIRIHDPNLKKASIYGYYKKAMRDDGVDAGATLILQTPDGEGWFWFIPLADDLASVGVVAAPDYLFKGRGRDFGKILAEEVEKCIPVRDRLAQAEREGKIYTVRDFSYRSSRCSGPGYVLIGDAWGFIDPVYSTGIYLALKSGEMAAEAIDGAFEHNDFSGERLGSFGPVIGKGIESLRKLVYAFYTKEFSFGRFMRDHPQFRSNLIDLLVGDVMKEGVDDIFGPISEVCDLPEPLYPDGGKSKTTRKPRLAKARK